MASANAVKLTLATSRQPFSPERPLEAECRACGSPLDIHQPDIGRPDRLLGTCDHCGAWFLATCRAEKLDCVLLQLPEDEAIRKAMAPPKKPPGEAPRPPRSR